MSLTWAGVCARRLQRHGLLEPALAGHVADQLGAICGAHAQVMSAAELSLGLRVEGLTRTGVRDALWITRSLVKTYGPRGTVHLLPARDLATWTAALGRVVQPPRSLPPALRLTAGQTDDIVAAVTWAVREDDLTMDELSAAVVERAGSWAGDLVMPAFATMWPRWRIAITTAANRGALCFGPNRGPKVTFTSPHRWVPGFEPVEANRALADVVRLYLHAYGPATPQQFAHWLGAARPWALTLFDHLSAELETVEVDGVTSWVVAGDASATAGPGTVRLLPYFDAYVVGAHPRDRVFPGPAAERALSGGQAGTVSVLLIDGVVAGVWHQRRSGRTIRITVEPFGALTAAQRLELEEQGERIGSVLEGRTELAIGEVGAGHHL